MCCWTGLESDLYLRFEVVPFGSVRPIVGPRIRVCTHSVAADHTLENTRKGAEHSPKRDLGEGVWLVIVGSEPNEADSGTVNNNLKVVGSFVQRELMEISQRIGYGGRTLGTVTVAKPFCVLICQR